MRIAYLLGFKVPSTTSPFALTHGRKANIADWLKWSPAIINLILLVLPLPKWVTSLSLVLLVRQNSRYVQT